jgi:hypothetical protein
MGFHGLIKTSHDSAETLKSSADEGSAIVPVGASVFASVVEEAIITISIL